MVADLHAGAALATFRMQHSSKADSVACSSASA